MAFRDDMIVDHNCIGELPSISILKQIEGYRKYGESLFDTAERILLLEAIYFGKGRQCNAAAMLGVSPRQISYRLQPYEARPIDRNSELKEGYEKMVSSRRSKQEEETKVNSK